MITDVSSCIVKSACPDLEENFTAFHYPEHFTTLDPPQVAGIAVTMGQMVG
jgi:hypothetical protein